MNLTVSAIRCSLQVALLGAITNNLRAVNVEYNENQINIFFYYANVFSDEEIDLSEIVSTEVMTNFFEVSVVSEREIIPLNKYLPNKGIRVFHRAE
jgi:hypothetical protein